MRPLTKIDDLLLDHERIQLSTEDLERLRKRLAESFASGRGASVDDGSQSDILSHNDADQAISGAYIPIPAEMFLEELSHRLALHPISVYWLLNELLSKESLACPPEMKRQMEEFVSMMILDLLGHRWPEQDEFELQHGSIIDSDLVDADGIIPLVKCADQTDAYDRDSNST